VTRVTAGRDTAGVSDDQPPAETFPFSDQVAAALPEEVAQSSWDPTPGPHPDRRWWGRPFAETRWTAELVRLLVDPVYLGVGLPRGDRTPVMVIPGFLAGESSLYVLEGWLRRLGYNAYGSGVTWNVDCSNRAVDRLERMLRRVHGGTGRRVVLVGHSRGGHFAKALAHRRPEMVRGVISMGSGLDTAFDISIPTKLAVTATRRVLQGISTTAREKGCFTHTCDCRFTRDFSAAFPEQVPLTSIWTRGDGVVWPDACQVPYARNVEVTGSHVGLAFNRKAYRAIAMQLAEWQDGAGRDGAGRDGAGHDGPGRDGAS
jgi:triacylglycerol lipase